MKTTSIVLVLLTSVMSAFSQDIPKIKPVWRIVSSMKSYVFLIDVKSIRETTEGTLIALQARAARDDTKEGELAKAQNFPQISRIIGTDKAKRVAYETTLVEINCVEYKRRDLRIWLVDEKGNFIFTFPAGSSGTWETPRKDSNNGNVIRGVCETYFNK